MNTLGSGATSSSATFAVFAPVADSLSDPMNFVKGLWDGNACPNFESICLDVDKLMGKDVQVVDMSFKRLYSNVVEDLLPFSGNTEERREQLADSECHARNQICSARDIKTTATCADKNDLSINHGCTDTLRNSDASVPLQHGHLMHFDMPSCEDPSQEKKYNLNFRARYDANISDREDNIAMDTASAIINSCSSNEFFVTSHDEDHKNSSPTAASSPALIDYKEDQLATRQLRFTFSDDGDCLSNASGSGWLSEGEFAMLEHPNSDEAGTLSLPMEAPADEFNTDIIGFMDLPIHCSRGALAKDGFPSNEVLTKNENSDISRSFKSSEIVSTYFSKSEEFGMMTKTISEGSAYSISTSSSPTAIYETKPVETFPAITILESNVCSCGSSNERYPTDGQTTTAVSPPRTDPGEMHEFSDGISDLNMDIVDLSPQNVQPDAKTVELNHSFVLATSHRRKDFTYYKELLKDRLTSRKRLSKDYKLLPILYGDIDMESDQNFERSSVLDPLSLETMRTRSFDEMSETEWELL